MDVGILEAIRLGIRLLGEKVGMASMENKMREVRLR